MTNNNLATILVIDDLPENLALLSELLNNQGYEVKVARSGQLALRTLDYFQPDLILLDIAMPDMDGYQVCTHLKNNPVTADIPVIFLTALDQTQDQVKAFSLGGSDYIVKPMREEEVIARINTQLKIVRQQRKLKQEIEERKKAEAIAQEALAEKSRFLANISHEIRTPLSAMVSVTELLALTNLDSRQKDLVKILQSSSDYLLSLMNDILDFSKLESAKIQLEAVDFCLDQLIEEIIDLFAVPASLKGIELYYFKGDQVPSNLLADQLRLRQVLTNLMSNALKFTHQGEIIIDVQLKQFSKQDIICNITDNITDNTQSDYLMISVQDTGIGMSEETITKIFQPFTQADLSVSRVYGGTGLGLNICQQLIKLMGGEIGLDSTMGQGSKFWFTIPVKKLAVGSLPISSLPISLLPINQETQQILIVDPAPTRRRLLTEYAHSRGLEVISVKPKEFYSYCEQEQPPILEDVIMIMINQEVFDQVPLEMNWPKTLQDLPIVIITNNQSYQLPLAIAPQRIFAYLTRPVKLSAFHKCLDAWQEGAINLIEQPLASPYYHRQLCQHKILVVEDTIINQKVILNLLAELGYQADCVNHGKAALEKIEKQSYDLVFMDCQMPILDGFDTVEIIRQLEQITVRQQPPLIIIGLTAATGSEVREKCLQVGMNDYLTKPINLNKLTQVLNKWLNKCISEIELISDNDLTNKNQQNYLSEDNLAKFDHLLIDLEKLRQITRGNQDLARELIQDFILDTQVTLTNLKRAIADQDIQLAKALAHTIRGNAGTLGVKYMWEISASLEHQIGHQYWAKCSQLTEELDHILQNLQTYAPEYTLNQTTH